MTTFYESDVEKAALNWLSDLGWNTAFGSDIAPEKPNAERDNFSDCVLKSRLQNSLRRINSNLPFDPIDEVVRQVLSPNGTTLEDRNRAMHRMLVDGVNAECRTKEGTIRGATVDLIDFENPDNNDWLAVNQFAITENKHNRRADIALFVNGMPLGLIELKNPTDEDATIWTAWQQFQTYKAELPTLFSMNAMLIVSDGLEARIGTLTADKEWFKAWRTVSGESEAGPTQPQLEVLLSGVCDPPRFLSLIRDFMVIQDDGIGNLTKIMAGYHQFHAVEVAVSETIRATKLNKTTSERSPALRESAKPASSTSSGDRRIGVVWHTQGSGKSLTMAFYAGRIIREPALANPTVVVLTDRNDLDEQLFNTFATCKDLLRQPPAQADSRLDLRKKLAVEAGGVVFTTIQKFFPDEKGDQHPLLSDRHNIVVIADEAHRSQYAFIDGYARHMRDALPNASFVGFTGTPIELEDANTRAVFGDYISIYDIRRSVEDAATVPIYYESRLAKLELDESKKPKIDPEFDEATEHEEVEHKEQLKSKWSQLEAVVGSPERIRLIAKDIADHFESRLSVMEGKAMVVCMSRRICVDLYNELTQLRPDWKDEDDERGKIKIIMTGSASDPPDWQRHIRSKARREKLARRFRNPADPFQIALVRDLWLTGFDAPSLHTMYVDKPMRGHGLMQAVARVNRVFKDKPGGLIVDYLGLAHELKHALDTYTQSGGKGSNVLEQSEAVAVMLEKHEVCCALMHGLDYSAWANGNASERLKLLPEASERILAQENGKKRFVQAVSDLSHAFALSVPHEETIRIRDDVQFFQSVRVALTKSSSKSRSDEGVDNAIRQIISKAVSSDEVIDIFSAAGLRKPDVSILSDEFLAEVKGMKRRNVAVELLQKLLKGEISARRKSNVVQARLFSEMLEQTLKRYQNRAIEAAQVIEELIQLAKDMREANARGQDLGLTEDELAFYDALETNDSAVKVLGDETLREIAQSLVATIRNNVTIDWMIRESVRAELRIKVKRVLRKYNYPPDKQEKAALTVLKQAEVLSANWAGD